MGTFEYMTPVIAALGLGTALVSLGWQIYLHVRTHCLKVSCQLRSAKTGEIPDAKSEDMLEIVWSVTNTGRVPEYIEKMIVCMDPTDDDSNKIFPAADLMKKKKGGEEKSDTSTQGVKMEPRQSKRFSESRSGIHSRARMPESFWSVIKSPKWPIKHLRVCDGTGKLWEAPKKNVQEINEQFENERSKMRS